jgi:uracil-DNA glycosylase family 4
MGFFDESQSVGRQPPSLIPRCPDCGLYTKCKSPKMPVYGNGAKGIMIIGESPAKVEDERNRPFQGMAGVFLQDKLRKFGFDFDEDFWITNAIICRPTTEEGENRNPTEAEVKYCRPNAIKAIRELKPRTIILLGKPAIQSIVGWIWENDVDVVGKWVGWNIPDQKTNSWICPIWHPSYIIRTKEEREALGKVTENLFDRYLEAALSHTERPWKTVPDWDSEANVVMEDKTACFNIQQIVEFGKPVAFDYECDGLKPENQDLGIICVSMSNGEFTFAYPWTKATAEATKKFLLSPVPKICQNANYEIRWSINRLGVMPRNIVWDTMLTTHALDTRKGICGLEFQEFVRLGFSGHKSWIKPFMKSVVNNCNSKNRLMELDLRKVLKYCALDALIEWKLADIQAKAMGVEI